MRRFALLMAAVAFLALPCFAEVFILRDGTEIDGSVTRTSEDGRITIRTPTGIRSHHVSEFTADTIDKHFSDIEVRQPQPVPSPSMSRPRRTQTEPDRKTQTTKPKAILGLI